MLEDVANTAEGRRLTQSSSQDSAWRRWGPYVSARQWGTVREDYSADGDAWESFGFDQAHTRVYRWGEDGLGGLCDRYGFLNLAVALWNGRDDRLKERLFGLTGPQGNHGEDVKEYYWALDATPTHSWAQWLYRYPQAAFPYAELLAANAERGHDVDEYELADTGILAENRFFDVMVTHAKASAGDVVVVVYEATNHGPDAAPLDLIPQLWLRNTWAWGRDKRHASMQATDADEPRGFAQVVAEHAWLHRVTVAAEGEPRLLWCDNETDEIAAFGASTRSRPYPKNAINEAIVHGNESLLSPDPNGTKVGFWYHIDSVAPGETVRVRLRLSQGDGPEHPFADVDAVLNARHAEADEFYAAVIPAERTEVDRTIARRAFAGLNWGKQLYRYSVREWLQGDPAQPAPPPQRREPGARNVEWTNLDLADIISMPDDWEYPWFASWDLAFHCVALAHIDPAFAKQQLLLICREWAQHPDGQLPAYEWNFSDVNPPVHAWAAWLVYIADGGTDTDFLTRIMTKLMLNFGWWVNRKDEAGNELFEGGFLGMDNISLFDRSRAVPHGMRLEQSDATSWIAFFCLRLLRIAEELALTNPAWGDVCTTFLERFLSISQAIENREAGGEGLWDDDDGFFYDILVDAAGRVEPLRVRSLVGLVPLLAVTNTPRGLTDRIEDLVQRRLWLKRHRPDLAKYMLSKREDDAGATGMTLSLVDNERYPRVIQRLFDEGEFLSDYGIRSLSAAYREGADVPVAGDTVHLRYVPGYSEDAMFGGNSNWRGPVWMPLNVLIAEALRVRAAGVGGEAPVEFPTGSGQFISLGEAADRLDDRLLDLFRPGPDGRRPGAQRDQPSGPLWDAYPVFSEYFHGDLGTGLGASHQTGWTALVAHVICRRPGSSDGPAPDEGTPTPAGPSDQPTDAAAH